MLRELLLQLDSQVDIDEDSDEKTVFNMKERVFKKVFKKQKVVIYIDNIDILLNKTRQSFFYTFLDDLKYYTEKPFVILGTSNLYLENLLEKRLKSRFTFTPFYFSLNDQKIEKFLEGVMKSKE